MNISQFPAKKRINNRLCDSELASLNKLVNVLSSNPNRQPLPPIDCDVRSRKHLTTEAILLEKFSIVYGKQRDFSSGPLKSHFLRLLEAVLKNRFHFSDWVEMSKPEHVLRVVTCLRLLMRDQNCRECVHEMNGLGDILKVFKHVATRYLTYDLGGLSENIILELLNIFQKLLSNINPGTCPELDTTVKLLVKLTRSCSKLSVVNNSVHTIFFAVQIPEQRSVDVTLVENMVRILQDGHITSKILAGNVLNVLSNNDKVKEFIRQLQVVPVILSGLKFRYAILTWSLLWTLIRLFRHSESVTEMVYRTGGIPIFVDLLRNDNFHVINKEDAFTPSSALGKIRNEHISDKKIDDEVFSIQILYVKYAVCVAITEVSANIACAKQIVANNGLFHLGNLILPFSSPSQLSMNLQSCAFRALRFIFTFEKNQTMFRCLFPAEIYNKFIEIQNFSYDLADYEKLVAEINLLPATKIEDLTNQLSCLNTTKKAAKFVRNYKLYSVIGRGAFGVVYCAKRFDGNKWLAVKQIKTSLFRDNKANLENIVQELAVIEKELNHPNIVRYYKTFMEEESLYIVMEYIDGISLDDLVLHSKERGSEIPEQKIWRITVQIILALRYLHVEKNVVHRDLTSRNIIIGDNEKITLTDFGLAKVGTSNQDLMSSLVGTRCFCSPEILLDKNYCGKVDVWAMGCVVYHLCRLELAFGAENTFDLVTNIVNGIYLPISGSKYSQHLRTLISQCLTVAEEDRPDVEILSASVNNKMIDYFEFNSRLLRRNPENVGKQTRGDKIYCDCNPYLCEKTNSETSLDSGLENCLQVNKIESSFVSSPRYLPSISSTKSALSLSQHSIRIRNDPVLQMLEIMNRIRRITASDYEKCHEMRVLVVDRFCRILFSPTSSAILQKQHLNLLLKKSNLPIELGLSSEITEIVNEELRNEGRDILDVKETEGGVITYESLYFIIESIE